MRTAEEIRKRYRTNKALREALEGYRSREVGAPVNAYALARAGVMGRDLSEEEARRQSVTLHYTPEDRGRGGRGAYWALGSPLFHVKPDAHWSDRGQQTFPVPTRENKEPQRLAAMEWANEHLGIPSIAWVKAPWTDDYLQAPTFDHALEVIFNEQQGFAQRDAWPRMVPVDPEPQPHRPDGRAQRLAERMEDHSG